MSGISGIWNLDGKPLSEELLRAVGSTLQHRGPDSTAFWRQGPIGLSANLLRVTSASESQPVVHSSGCVLVFDGRIDNREELIAELRPDVFLSDSSSDPHLTLLACLRWGQTAPAHLVGDFAFAYFDPQKGELLLARDAIGIRPLYFYPGPNFIIFGSEVKALLAHPDVKTKPNESYLAVIVMGGMPPTDLSLTLFENVFGIPPAHLLTVTRERRSLNQYWDFDVRKQIRCRSSQEYVEGFRHYFRQSVRRRLRSDYPVAITVSGGLDSSSIFCVAQKLRQAGDLPCPEIVGVTHTSEPGTPSDEQEFVRAIERDYDVTIQRVPVQFRGLLEGIHSSVLSFEFPLGDLQWYSNMLLLQMGKAHGARSMLTGHWGDQILFQQAYLVDVFRRLKWRQVKRHLSEISRSSLADPAWFLHRFYRDLIKNHVPACVRPAIAWMRARAQRPSKDQPWFAADFRQLAARSLSRYDPPKAKFCSVHARTMYEEVRAKYYVQAMELHNKSGAGAGMDMLLPFLDRDLLWFLMSIPGEILTEGGVHRGLLRKSMEGILPQEIRERRSKANYTHLENEMMQRQYAEVREFFSGNSEVYTRGYVDPIAIRQELESMGGIMKGEGCRTAWSLGDLMGLEVWLQEFFVRAGS